MVTLLKEPDLTETFDELTNNAGSVNVKLILIGTETVPAGEDESLITTEVCPGATPVTVMVLPEI